MLLSQMRDIERWMLGQAELPNTVFDGNFRRRDGAEEHEVGGVLYRLLMNEAELGVIGYVPKKDVRIDEELHCV